MTSKLVSLKFTDAQITAVDAALTALETQLAGLVALPVATKRSLRKMGPKSEAFCRQTLRVLDQNPQILPANFTTADAAADLATQDQLRPRLIRLARLGERAADTDMALGGGVMETALQGYRLLKVSGRAEGLEPLRRELGTRFAKASRRIASPPVPQPVPQPVAQAEAKAA